MEKLELKHIAPYLPYGLKVEFNRKIYPKKRECQVLTINTLRLCEEAPSKFSIKPLLRPLSDLYKEIDGVVGIVEIAKMLSGTVLVEKIDGCCTNLSYFKCTFEDGFEELIINENCEGWYRSYFDKINRVQVEM